MEVVSLDRWNELNSLTFYFIHVWDWGFVLFFHILSHPDSGLRKERRRKKKITNIISFDDDLDGGAEDEEEGEDDSQKMGVMRKSHTAPAQNSVEEGIDPLEPVFSESLTQNGLAEPGIVSWVGSPHPSRTPPLATPPLPDSKSIDNEEEEEEEEEMYKPKAQTQEEERISSDQWVRSLHSSVGL